jgi:small-conductance mechanosensitive channel
MLESLDAVFFGNPAWRWGAAALTFLALFWVLRVARKVLLDRAMKLAETTDTLLDDMFIDMLRNTRQLVLLIVSLYGAAVTLTLPLHWWGPFNSLVVIAAILQGGFWANALLAFWVHHHVDKRAEAEPDYGMMMGALTFGARLAMWSLVILLILGNMGIDVTAMVTGLGISGIAIALAVQNVLGDLFASLSIVLDKPFVVGDFIEVGDDCGTVEKVGLKTTRVRALSGEQMVLSNNDLLTSRVHNYKQMAERRIAFTLGITYGTPADTLAAIPGIVQQLIEATNGVRFDRCHFKNYGDFSLNFETVYYVLVPDYAAYMDVQQAINLAVYRAFEEKSIDFAFPTQTVHLEKAEQALQ